MTYQVDTTAALVLDEPPFVGVEVVVRLGVGYGVVRRVDDALRRFHAADPADVEEAEREVTLAEERDALDEAFTIFATEALISWNLSDHKGDIPADAESFPRLPLGLARVILNFWRAEVGKVPDPLALPSDSTETLPTVRLSSLLSSMLQNSTDGGSDTTETSESSTPKTPTDSSEPSA